MYKYQHLYLPVAYGILGLKFRVQDITDTFMKWVRCAPPCVRGVKGAEEGGGRGSGHAGQVPYNRLGGGLGGGVA
jgi:hypothetical protein